MGMYVAVRGWIECDDKQLELIKALIVTDAGYYSGGWAFPSRGSWTNYVFYGADIRAHELDEILSLIRRIAALPASDADNDRVCGFFLATHEVEGASQWQVRDGAIVITTADPALSYLDD